MSSAAGQVGVFAHISAVQAVHRHVHGSKPAQRPVAGPVLIIYAKRELATETAVNMVAPLRVMAVVVEQDTVGRVAGKVSYIGVFACKRMAVGNNNHDKTSKGELNNKSVVSEGRQHIEHFDEFLFLSCKSTEWSFFF